MTLNDQFATPQAYVDHLNAQQPEGSMFKLVYGEHMGATPQDVADYLDMSTFSDWYKDVNGFRPRGFTLEEARDWMERESANPTPLDDDFDVPAHVLADDEAEADADDVYLAVEAGRARTNTALADALSAALESSDESPFARFNRAVADDLRTRLPRG